MFKSTWNYPTNMMIGENRIQDLKNACQNLNIKKPLFVTDNVLVKNRIFLDTVKLLDDKKFKTKIFSNVVGNPTGKNVYDGVEIFNKNDCDGVIAFGGGSGLDVGKAIAFMSAQNLPIWDFEDIGDNWKKANSEKIAPIIAIPTTAGTGSETGRASVILNENTGIKKIIFHPKFLPSIVILDPILTINLPPEITASTGMDAFAHNLEAFCAPGYHPMADVIEKKIIKICQYLELKKNSFDGFLEWLLDFRKKLKIPHKLSEILDEKDFDINRLSKMALEDPSTNSNPKKLTEADMKIMYQNSMSGKLFL